MVNYHTHITTVTYSVCWHNKRFIEQCNNETFNHSISKTQRFLDKINPFKQTCGPADKYKYRTHAGICRECRHLWALFECSEASAIEQVVRYRKEHKWYDSPLSPYRGADDRVIIVRDLIKGTPGERYLEELEREKQRIKRASTISAIRRTGMELSRPEGRSKSSSVQHRTRYHETAGPSAIPSHLTKYYPSHALNQGEERVGAQAHRRPSTPESQWSSGVSSSSSSGPKTEVFAPKNPQPTDTRTLKHEPGSRPSPSHITRPPNNEDYMENIYYI